MVGGVGLSFASGKLFGVESEKVHVHGKAYFQQLLCVDGAFQENFLNRPRVNADAVGQPLVGVALPAQFGADQFAYVYLHSGCSLRVVLPVLVVPPTANKEGEHSRLQTAVVEAPKRIDKKLAKNEHLYLYSLCAVVEFSTFQSGWNK